jgi:pimeloyl-ACP methyl ester carboxylesterase
MNAEWARWDRRDSGPADAEHTVLLLPGGMCTAAQYEELMAEPALAAIHLVAVTMPGQGGTPPPQDLSLENYARLPPDRRDALVADLRKNDPRIVRRGIRGYLRYLDRHGSVAPRLAAAGVPAWVVHGERGDGGITGEERRTLERCPQITVITIPGASYLTPNEEPALVARLLVEALEQATRPADGRDQLRSG